MTGGPPEDQLWKLWNPEALVEDELLGRCPEDDVRLVWEGIHALLRDPINGGDGVRVVPCRGRVARAYPGLLMAKIAPGWWITYLPRRDLSPDPVIVIAELRLVVEGENEVFVVPTPPMMPPM